MALFGSDNDQTEKKTKKIRPTVLRVQNVAKELLALAKTYSVKVETIDFNILEIQSYTRLNDGEKESEWEEISDEELRDLDDNALLNPLFQIKQMYEIEFFTRPDDASYKDFNIAVGANATKCKVYLSIKEGSVVEYSSRFEKDLLHLINKAKVRAGILVGIFDEMVPDVISRIVAQVRVQEKLEYKQNETILIAESYEPTLTVDDQLIIHYDRTQEELDENQRVDYASRGFIKSVKKDDVLIEYIKAKEGKPGRNCRGEYMAPKEPEISHEPTFSVDDTIREEDTPKHRLFIANESGYVSFEDNTYSVKTQVEMDEISFKKTGNIVSGLDSEVNITVTETNVLKDAIGNGMEVEVTEIEVEGNVGANAKLRAIKAKINGQTHKDSTIRADKLDINVHRGKAYGKNVTITRLEHGVIDCDSVEITQAMGGDIRAREIKMEICTSHVTATSSKIIEIKKLQGSENKFIIDPLLKKSSQGELENIKEDILERSREVRNTEKEIKKYKEMIKGGMASFNDVKKRLAHYKKNNIKMPESFVQKYKNFLKTQEHLKALEEHYALEKNELEMMKSKTSIMQDNIFDARVINRGVWKGYNQIIFKLLKPKVDLVYKPAEGSHAHVFGLVEVAEGEYEIQVLDE